MKRVIILTALPVEYKAVREYLAGLSEHTHPKGTVYEVGTFEDWEVAIAETGPGNQNATLEAERAISFFAPQVVVFVGVAGGIKDVRVGDVVAATKVYGYESGKADGEFLPRPDVGATAYSLQQRCKAEAKKSDWTQRLAREGDAGPPSVIVAPIAAGEKVVSSTRSATYEFIRKQYGDAAAVEMEGRGCLVACQANSEVEAVIIRGISDLVDGKSDADAAGSQERAAANAAAFAFEVISKHEIGHRTSARVPVSANP